MFITQDLSFTQISLFSTTAVVVWFTISYVKSWYHLRHIPGPWLASFSRLWLARVSSSGKQYDIYRDLCNKYGPLVRIGPNELTTDDPEIIRRMSAARSTYGKDEWYLGGKFNPYVPIMVNILDPVLHDKIKVQTAGGYSGRDTSDLQSGVDPQVKDLLALIRRKYISNSGTHELRLLDFALLTSYFTLDVITLVGFGKKFGFLDADCDLYNFVYSIRNYWPMLSISLDIPWIRDIVYSPLFLKYYGPKLTDAAGMGKMMGVAHEIVGNRFMQKDSSKNDMLESFRRNGLSQEQCEAECLFMVIAGSDTTASVLRIAMLYIICTPYVYRKFKVEIANAVRKGVSSPISVEEAKKIPYLQAIIYESLRMRPPAVALYHKKVPAEGDVIHGKLIPGGTAIGMNLSSLLRSKTIFGDDADIFRPERFMEADEPTRLEMERDVELVFGYGRWMCAGKIIAFMELNKVLFELLRAFDFQLGNPYKPWDSQSYSLFVEENMWLKVSEAAAV